MKIRALITLCGAAIHAAPGEIIDVTDNQALSLIEARAAEFVEEKRVIKKIESAEAPANRRPKR